MFFLKISHLDAVCVCSYPNSVFLLHPCDRVIHTPAPPHTELHTDISCSAHNNNKRCLIYSQCRQTSHCKTLPACSSCCPTGFLRSPISQISITSSFMLLINLQNTTCCDSTETRNYIGRGCVAKQILLLIMLWKKVYVLLILLES